MGLRATRHPLLLASVVSRYKMPSPLLVAMPVLALPPLTLRGAMGQHQTGDERGGEGETGKQCAISKALANRHIHNLG